MIKQTTTLHYHDKIKYIFSFYGAKEVKKSHSCKGNAIFLVESRDGGAVIGFLRPEYCTLLHRGGVFGW